MSDFKFDGVYCPSVTITHEDGSLDLEHWGQHLDHLVEAGISGVLVFGSIGEFYALPMDQKKRAVAFAAERLAGRCQLLVGVGGTVFAEVREMARYAQEVGADAVVAVSPFYFGPSEEGAVRFFRGIAEACDLPIVLYNFPDRTGTDLSPALVARIAREVPSVTAIKDTVDTISHTRQIIAAVRPERPDFCVLSGFDEYYLPNRIAGGNGVICGLTNVEPETLCAMDRAWKAGDMDKAVACAERVSHLMELYAVADLFISAVKGGVKAKGLDICTQIFEPAVQLTDDQQARIQMILD